jgi:RNA polymerase sigma factor (sigma-70 family)
VAKGRNGSVARLIQTLLDEGRVGGVSDQELLRRFTARGQDAAGLAFSVLLERHGPMVLRVCRGILCDEHDAQDAFQATFLVLARKAGALRVSRSLAPWLYGVALRTASCARSSRTTRRQHERIAAEMAARVVFEEDPDDLGPVLHEEIERLPEVHRGPILLCYFQGLTHEQAAEQLDVPVGTVRSRLARARDRLRARLTRRGCSPDLAALGSPCVRIPSLPEGLIDPAIRAATPLAVRDAVAAGLVSASAAALTEGVLRTMLVTKWKMIAAALLAIGAITSGVGLYARQERVPTATTAPPRSPPSNAVRGRDAGTPDDYAAELEELVRRVRREQAAGDFEGAVRDLHRIEIGASQWIQALANHRSVQVQEVPAARQPPPQNAIPPSAGSPTARPSTRPGMTVGPTSPSYSQFSLPGASEPASTERRLSELERKIDRLLLAFEANQRNGQVREVQAGRPSPPQDATPPYLVDPTTHREVRAGQSPTDPTAKTLTPPPPGVQGRVERVDGRGRRVEISIGSDDGLVPGHELNIYRHDGTGRPPAARYLGRIRITATDPDQSVAELIESDDVRPGRIKEGDQVSTRAPSPPRERSEPATP